MNKKCYRHIKLLAAVAAAALSFCGTAAGQNTPSRWDTIQYNSETPLDTTPLDPCPQILINERYGRSESYPQVYIDRGWDTVVSCNVRQIELTSEPYIPVQYFNGRYTVTQIPYNPPDTSFCLRYAPAQRQKQAISSDDRFAPNTVNIAFPFYFFGIQKNYFRLGDNGIVTFTTKFSQDGTSQTLGCPYSINTGLPWTSNTPTYSGDCFNRMHDAIYGVCEDTYTGSGGAYMSGEQGIYYGVVDSFPCQKIICTWNEIPIFNNSSRRESYQIVCYEGSNIIEVHVKKRCNKPSTSNGLIGIQNETGTNQVRGGIGESTHYVGDPTAGRNATYLPAFWAGGWNTNTASSGEIERIAYRFTPEGRTNVVIKWYRIFDDGRDSALLTTDHNDTNGYIVPMNQQDARHPTLTKAYVKPTCVSRYVVSMVFKNAKGDNYSLSDTITIGIDTANDLSLRRVAAPGTTVPVGEHEVDVCNGTSVDLMAYYPTQTQQARNINWTVERILNGRRITLDSTMYTITDGTKLTLNPDPQYDTLPLNHIDSVRVQVSVEFVSRCVNYDTFLVRVFPNFDTVDRAGICLGESYRWHANGQVYTSNVTTQRVNLHSQPGCDSTVRLELTVYDVSHQTEYVSDCKPYTWRNGRTYAASNAATAATDTVVEHNRYGCDSVITLNFTLHPLKARIHSDIDEFTLDNLDAVLTDISTGGDARRWLLPTLDADGDSTSNTLTDAVVYYTIPSELDGATIWLIDTSYFGCVDTASVYLPLNKENFWVPNAFTPGDPAGNNLFGSVSRQTVMQEMFIYNRAGMLVYHCSGADCQWDGRDANGQPCPQGSYAYVIKYNNRIAPKITHVRRGAVTLIR